MTGRGKYRSVFGGAHGRAASAGVRITLLISLLVLGAGCRSQRSAYSSDGRKAVRVTLMFISTQQAEYYRWAERVFEEQNPDVDIIVEQFPGTSLKDYEIKLRLRFSSRTAPDAFVGIEHVVAEFARLELLDPAPDYIETMVQNNSLNEMVRRAPYVDGTCYGIVNDAVWQALYYNKSMFREAGLDPEQPPATWEELLDYADLLTVRRADGTPVRTGFFVRKTGFKPGTAEKWFTFLYSAGGRPFSEDGTRATFNSPAGRSAMELYQALLFDRRIDDITIEGDQQGFGQGRVAMFLREGHVIRWMGENYPNLDFGVAPVPAGPLSISSGGSYVYAVSADSPHRDVSWRFIEFLMQDEAYERYTSIGGLLPVTRSIADLPQYRDDPQLRVYVDQDVAAPPSFTGIQQAGEILGAYIERFCYGRIGIDEMLERAERDVNGVLMRNRRRGEYAHAR